MRSRSSHLDILDTQILTPTATNMPISHENVHTCGGHETHTGFSDDPMYWLGMACPGLAWSLIQKNMTSHISQLTQGHCTIVKA